MVTEFHPEALTDFSNGSNSRAMEGALDLIEGRFGTEYPLFIEGREVTSNDRIDSLNPSDPEQVVGRVSAATPELADLAVKSASRAFDGWASMSFDARAAVMLRAANIMRRRRFELDAVEVLEAGKSWIEADADVAEAIDFCDFYAREAMRYGDRQPLTFLPGEASELTYLPLGVVVVIPPWNFPLAITAGMTVGALVTGNTVVLKPASSTPVTAWYLLDILREAGVPDGVLQYLPGSGGLVGDTLVAHPLTRMIAFTGSREVGLHINETAARTADGQKWIKRVIAEMGGKDFIIVDEETDLDEAAQGIVTSAYGFQGQKCSACSRAIIVDAVYDQVIDGIVERVKALRQGPMKDPDNNLGPVITESAMNGILKYIETGKGEGRLLHGGARLDRPGYFVEPTVIADVKPGAVIEQEEIFGPVLACIKARDFDHAVEIANDTVYGLTGAVYSRNRGRLEKGRRDLFVGNLYFNRKCTGALVGVHPFGGFNMSGTDSKAGGRDYLGLFLQAKSVSEKL
ncbi:MAG: L-glutamate gamma-semialdehyde dehydrogenase [Deltaproteobacteria bacterium]|nr:L-glutamate gamma-semialdehyde dehydrogenase [Deltaproteobacteria bacterium]